MTDRTPATTAAPTTPAVAIDRRERRKRLLKAALLTALSLAAFTAELLLLALRGPERRRGFFGGAGRTGGDG
ncbi:hypothetical protein GFH48_21925 [Streptomyces fagopyri]|uniref:Uncharacterized protein n=1 Tax=Streptomyces fagopyri TaxID=2662397 RepID=A0A5Q0LEU5_9ACTN|nr:hypothetical protein [Streptomyces fagopyri]QFZ75563.1 hypothetical protein GFH48_21925 [Streptomyces fagopyri]